MLTAEQIHRIRKTFAIVEEKARVSALLFYQRVFELDPSLRPLFKTDIEEQSAKLMEMLSMALSLLDRPEQLTGILEDLGARHLGYGVENRHYDTVGAALLGMLESVLGTAWNEEVRLAWTTLYQAIAEAMIRGAEKAAHQGKTGNLTVNRVPPPGRESNPMTPR